MWLRAFVVIAADVAATTIATRSVLHQLGINLRNIKILMQKKKVANDSI